MASFHVWLEVLSWTKALFEATTLGADLRKAYEKHRKEKSTIEEARRCSRVFSTYSEEELQAVLKRLEGCRDRFVSEGSGTARRQCQCSVFKDVIDGNGGDLPEIDDWRRIFRQLRCSEVKTAREIEPR
jgi:hypothetical protein